MGHLIVLTNDDGVDAPGLQALRQATNPSNLRRLVMAPADHQSGCSHLVTTGRPISLEERESGVWAVGGTPADCVRLAIHRYPDELAWVISGINAGGNLGADVHLSGTVAAVREATLHGIPGIAVSHYIARGRQVDWNLAAQRTWPILAMLMKQPPGPGLFWNVNLPHPAPGSPEPAVVFCPVDLKPLSLAFREEAGGFVYSGDYQTRPRTPGADVDVCFGGAIAVSKVHAVASADHQFTEQ